MADMTAMDRTRSRLAYRCVADWPRDKATDLKAEVQGLPILLRTQGSAATLAMLAKRSPKLADNLTEWLTSFPGSPLHGVTGLTRLLQRYVECDTRTARAVDAEARRFAEDLKRLGSIVHGGG